jgi:hypothetical protein
VDWCKALVADLCVQCVCDVSKRLIEANYSVIGPDAIPFRTCVLKNAVVLMSHGVTFAGMLAVNRECVNEQPCVQEYMAAAGQPCQGPTCRGLPVEAAGLVPPPSGRASHQQLLHKGQGESLMPPYTRGSISLSRLKPLELYQRNRSKILKLAQDSKLTRKLV